MNKFDTVKRNKKYEFTSWNNLKVGDIYITFGNYESERKEIRSAIEIFSIKDGPIYDETFDTAHSVQVLM